jgi:hypothetical protein
VLVTLFSLNSELQTARYFDIQDDARNWLPLPLLPAALVYLVARWVKRSERTAWAFGGFTFGLFACAFWDIDGVVALLAIPAMLAGAALGTTVYGTLRTPSAESVTRLLLTAGLLVPAALGTVDLYLRTSTA